MINKFKIIVLQRECKNYDFLSLFQIASILDEFEFKPLKTLADQLLGCTEQCPLCGAICAGGVACKDKETRSQNHSTEIHWPQVC